MDENPPITENPCSPAPNLPLEMLEKILQYLPLKDLKNCRLVWKGQDAIMKELIGKKMEPIRFNVNTKGLREHLKNYPNSPVPDALYLGLTFEEDHETIKEICENLRGKIKHLKINMDRKYQGGWGTKEMISCHTENQSQKLAVVNARLVVNIMETLGESLEILEFEIFKSGFLQVANKLAQKSSLAGNFNFPSLQKICMFGKPPNGKSGDENLSVWNQLIFKSCVKLKSFHLQQSDSKNKEAEVLKDLHEVGRLTQITSLKLGYFNSRQTEHNLDTLLQYEVDGGLQIEELHVENERTLGYKDEQKLERVLKMQSKKLKILKMFSVRGNGFIKNLKMPMMENLTSLKLATEDGLLEKICFGKITPKLKSLEVEIGRQEDKGRAESMKDLLDTTESCKTLKTLKITARVFQRQGLEVAVAVCEILARKFPCITSLILENPSGQFLQRVWTAWPNLLKLDLTLCEEFKDLDASLFAITPEWKKTVDKNVDQWWTLNQPPPDSQIQSVCNLEKLQALRIYRVMSTKYSHILYDYEKAKKLQEIENNFSEFSYFYGLKNMKHLKVFSSNKGRFVPREKEISIEAREFIREELPALRIHRC